MFGKSEVIGFGESDFYVKLIERDLANSIIVANHYSKKFYSATYIHLGLYYNNELSGVLQYGYAMNPASCSSVVANTKQNEYLELNRMWLDDKCPRNSESRAISYSIKLIKRLYPSIKWIQSFADERCKRFGVVYQASNFKYFGEHNATFWEIDGNAYHNTLMTAKNGKQGKIGNWLQANKDKATANDLRQFRYIYFINKHSIKDCLLKEYPYPKHGTATNKDIQDKLF